MIAASAVGWVPLAAVTGSGGITGDLPGGVDATFRWLPSGWAPVAVDAARRGEWPLALGALCGLAALTGALLLLWSRMLAERMTSHVSGSTVRTGVVRGACDRPILPRTPLGAALGRELRTWMREPRSAIELRVAILSGLLIVLVPLAIGSTALLPWGGATVAAMAGACACNIYGLEGSALWLTLVTPGAERVDVSAKQLAFLVIFGPVALLATLVLTPFGTLGDPGDLWPWTLATLPALVGGSAGVAVWIAATTPAPVPEAARRSGNLLASADNTGQAFVTLLLVPLVAVPPALVVFLGHEQGSVLLRWLGIPVGIASGAFVAWWLGAVTVRRLETRGPDLLDLLRHGPPVRSPAVPASSAWTPPPGLPGKIVLACWTLCWIPLFPQGLVPLAMTLTGTEAKSWFLALYVPDVWQWPVMLGMIALGLGLLGFGAWLTRREHRAVPGAT
jgi:ABC-2 type transport system permease protein